MIWANRVGELTAVTDAGEAKIFILKQPDEIIVDPSAQA